MLMGLTAGRLACSQTKYCADRIVRIFMDFNKDTVLSMHFNQYPRVIKSLLQDVFWRCVKFKHHVF